MKKTLSYIAICVFSAAVGLGIYSNQNTFKRSDLMSQNLEALALNHYEVYRYCCWPNYLYICYVGSAPWHDVFGLSYELFDSYECS